MRKKEMIAMLLAGGQGSRLGLLTKNVAKPAVTFGGKYRIIDFPLSNCINSGITTVGVLTQYMPLKLNQHIGIGIPWDLDRKNGGVTSLAPHVKDDSGTWYSGTANAIYQNIDFIDAHSPEYVLILSGDHIYKMDYSKMLSFHKKKNCDATIAVLEVTMEEASRFGIMNTEGDDKIYEFEEKPANPKSNLASMGIYIFTWKKLREALIEDNKVHEDSDFGQHIIPRMLGEGQTLYAYRFDGYWKDVGTIESYWQANMELIKTLPDFNLYEEHWKLYTNTDHQPPVYMGSDCTVTSSIVSEGAGVYGTVVNSVIGPDTTIEEGAYIKDSIIMEKTKIHSGARIERAIVAEGVVIGENVVIGEGENVPNELKPKIYDTGIAVIRDGAVVPSNVRIGKNCVISGVTTFEDYPDGVLKSGATLLKDEVE